MTDYGAIEVKLNEMLEKRNQLWVKTNSFEAQRTETIKQAL